MVNSFLIGPLGCRGALILGAPGEGPPFGAADTGPLPGGARGAPPLGAGGPLTPLPPVGAIGIELVRS